LPRAERGAIEAFALDAGGFGDFGHAAPRFGDLPQRKQQHFRLIHVVQRRL
jgi:hypothetical protein